ncbi:MAG: 50S ribosomal protein L25/general stress protein Ctc [Acetobacteraceae bacterium]|nr:50S ribosomal protein L25/general stress protein Ctc [Acetobacteraceae bacterium]
MVEVVTIEAEARGRAGKGAARATRREGKVPGVVYGARQAPALIAVDPKTILRELHRGSWRSRLYDVSVAGRAERALMREVQFHPVSDRPEHVDFQRLAAGQEIRVAVQVEFLNETTSPGIKRGGVLNVVRHEIEVYCTPETVPEKFTVDLGALDIGDSVHWSGVEAPEGIRPVISDRDFTIASVAAPTKMAEAAPTAEATPASAVPSAKGGDKPAAAPAAGAKAQAAKK